MSEVVTAQIHKSGIVEVTLEDRHNRNMFSKEIVQGLLKIFNTLPSDAKVVVIHGYENYFCCGGTQEELIQIAEGELTFADLAFYRLLLDCELPTIAAMQGHAIGGGLVFGCYADLIVLAEESIYTANFMKYGFTPGMGATYILAKKFGEVLANEMLFSANSYHGGELKDRNIAMKVVKKTLVIPTALELATTLAEKPLISLKLLKQNRIKTIKAELPAIIEQELAMHAISFKLPEVKDKIKKLFDQ